MKDITVDDITTGTLDGTGVYDKLMQVNKLHLQQEYSAQRITGDKYAEAYIAMMQSAMATAASFAIQSITANNQRELTEEEKARIIAQTQMIEAETLNVPKQGILLDKQAAQVDAQTSLVGKQEAQVVAETLNVPKQGQLLDAQKTLVTNQSATELKQALDVAAATTLKGKQGSLIDKQMVTETEQAKLVTANTAVATANKLNVDADTDVKEAQQLLIGKQEDMIDAQILTEKTNTTTPNAGIKKAEYDNLTKQGLNIESNTNLVKQKVKTEEAQIKDRVSGESSDVTGVVGAQKKVHAAQAKAFRDESYIKAAKQHADAFAVILSNDEGATIPNAFQSTAISTAVADMINQVHKTT
ncbi:hypothetical protein [Vibrio phage BUCT194]|uniref:Uncharacterized protein n=1 Tax=Vibrio phage BUCT194 TaxID=2859072 RepID=A0AAE9BPW5_9CAUD|nr:virion structural protein [Vibrio phage BUCT194]UAW01153.1 hypothetical protein [Vibrio phage BUCT194]